MAKKVLTLIKLQIPAGAANPAPPVGPALGQHGVNIMEFCKAFNERTQQDAGTIIPVEITVYEDRSFEFITKTPPAAVLIKEAAGIEKGSGEPNREKVGRISAAQVRQIAERKMPDPKVGTVTNDIAKAVTESKAGKVEYRTDRQAVVHLTIGKASFDERRLLENYAAVVDEIVRARPAAAKGRYLLSITLATTMGPGIRVDASRVRERDILAGLGDGAGPAGDGTSPEGERAETTEDAAEEAPA